MTERAAASVASSLAACLRGCAGRAGPRRRAMVDAIKVWTAVRGWEIRA